MESSGYETKEVVHKGRAKGRSKLKVSYTNVNGLVSSQWETDLYLREIKPDIIGVTETKLSEGNLLTSLGEGKYDAWRRDRKGKHEGGVMILTKKDIVVDKVLYGDGLAEVIKVEL